MNTVITKKTPPPDNFTANFKSGDFKGTVKFNHMLKTELVFSDPSSLCGLTITVKNGKSTIKYADMLFESDSSMFSDASLGSVLTDVISDMIVNNENIEVSEENGRIKRKTDNYTVVQNKDGTVAEIVCENHKINLYYERKNEK